MTRYKSDITRELFNNIDTKYMFVKSCRPRVYDTLSIFNAILYILKSGCQWSMLPNDYPPYKLVHRYFMKWSKSGVLDYVLCENNKRVRKRLEGSYNANLGIIDSSSIQNSDIPNGNVTRGYDGHKKVKGIKRFIVTDGIGLILGVSCTKANLPEIKGARILINTKLKQNNLNLKTIIADKGFKSKEFVKYHSFKNNIVFKAMIKTKRIKNKSEHPIAINIQSSRVTIAQYINKEISKTRYVVERTFAWMGKYRRLSKNYERSILTAESMMKLFGICIGLNKLCSFG
jgi:transposase